MSEEKKKQDGEQEQGRTGSGPEAEASAEVKAEATQSKESAPPAQAEPAEPKSEASAEAPAQAAEEEQKVEAGQSAEAKPAEPVISASEATPEAPAPAVDPEREAKLKAAAEARAARAAAKAKAEAEAAQGAGAAQATQGAGAAQAAEAAEPEAPKEPSRRQPDLERAIRILSDALGPEVILEAALNELNSDMPVIVLDKASWPKAAPLLRDHEELRFNYLRNVSGVDYETHLEVVYHLLSMTSKVDIAIKLRTDREEASIPSATPTWSTANWNEREIYDLLGIDFPGHPDMRRIMMPDDWVGHPLRKDYEPLDSEV